VKDGKLQVKLQIFSFARGCSVGSAATVAGIRSEKIMCIVSLGLSIDRNLSYFK
jgi:hypothetical protein